MIKINLGNIHMGREDYQPTITLPNSSTEPVVDSGTKELEEMHNNEVEEVSAVPEEIIVHDDNKDYEAHVVDEAEEKNEVVIGKDDESDAELTCDSCPVCHDAILFRRCEEVKTYTIQDKYLDGLGRVLDVSLKIKQVCPNKRVALGIAIVELDQLGKEYPRGLKTITIPAHDAPVCKDISVDSVRFIMPEDISVGSSTDMCQNCRRFRVRATAHYIDVACTMDA